LRVAVPRGGGGELPSEPARRRAGGEDLAWAATRTRHRRHIPSAYRAAEPLLRRAPLRAVRRVDSSGRDARSRTARTPRRLGDGRAARDLPDRRLKSALTPRLEYVGRARSFPSGPFESRRRGS